MAVTKKTDACIALSGRIDSANSAAVEQEITALLDGYTGTELTLDAEKLEYISSAGLRVLLRLRKRYVGLEIVNVASEVYEIFEMTGFTEMMPISKAYPMDQLIEALRDYQQNANRRITLEYILLSGVNDSIADANALADIIHDNDLSVLVNLIPYNEVKEKPYKRSKREDVSAFFDQLKKRAIEVTVRKEFGHDIDAACGQLRAKTILGGKADE